MKMLTYTTSDVEQLLLFEVLMNPHMQNRCETAFLDDEI